MMSTLTIHDRPIIKQNRAQASWAKSGEVMSKHKSTFKYGSGGSEPPPAVAAAMNPAASKKAK